MIEGSTTVNPFPLSAIGRLTYHSVKVYKSEEWALTGYTQSFFHEFPELQASGEGINCGRGPFTYSGTLSKSRNSYTTVLGTRFYLHDSNVQADCFLSVNISGVLRSLHVNQYFIVSGASIDQNQYIVLEAGRKFPIYPGSPIYLQVVGYRLIVADVMFTKCIDSSGNTIPVNFESYENLGLESSSFDAYYSAATTTCPTGCLTCNSNTECLICQPPKYQHNGNCYDLCPEIDRKSVV